MNNELHRLSDHIIVNNNAIQAVVDMITILMPHSNGMAENIMEALFNAHKTIDTRDYVINTKLPYVKDYTDNHIKCIMSRFNG